MPEDFSIPEEFDNFELELRHLLNKYTKENASGTPDYILAHFLTDVLNSFDEALKMRAEWRGESVELSNLASALMGLGEEDEDDTPEGS